MVEQPKSQEPEEEVAIGSEVQVSSEHEYHTEQNASKPPLPTIQSRNLKGAEISKSYDEIKARSAEKE